MTYQEAIAFMYQQLPAYQRIGKAAFKKDLTNIKALCTRLGDPQDRFRSIHIAGTNGKGSVSHMIASIMQEAGHTVGLYTSPHLLDFRERIRVNGRMISRNSVINFLKRITGSLGEIKPSFFEITVAMAFDHFARRKVDIAIIETGLGGRLDSTNIITPELSVITNIGPDHQNMLGDSLEEIAGEKAGIIKDGIPVIIGMRQKETTSVFRETALGNNADLYYADQILHCIENKYSDGVRKLKIAWKTNGNEFSLIPDMAAAYQVDNSLTALAAIQLLNERERFNISLNDMKSGIENVVRNTGFAGRWQVLATKPLVVLDGAHNEPGLKQAVIQLQEESKKDIHIIYGCVKDKDLGKILEILPANANYYITKPPVERARSISEMKDVFQSNNKNVVYASEDPAACLNKAKELAADDSIILITGSIFLVGAFLDS